MTVSRIKKYALFSGALFFCAAASAQNWLMDGGDNIRSGWNREEHLLAKDNVGKMKLL